MSKTWLQYFEEISAIPRPSYKEEKIAAYLMEFARERGLEATVDSAYNVLIRRGASTGYENAPTVVLQGHSDMVCEKNEGTVHDFDRDGIRLIREGEWLRADGTTLGADNGYAVAVMLAMLDDDALPHPALECLFTTAEETGMDGIRTFDKSQLRGRMMINLDSCEEKYATAACAGGVRTNLSCTPEAEDFDGNAIRLFVRGLKGGHSGEDIHRSRANALKLTARMLNHVSELHPRLAIWEGGNKDNAIPRECKVIFHTDDNSAAIEKLQLLTKDLEREMCADDSGFATDIAEENYSGQIMTEASSSALISLLRILPYGPMAMSTLIPGLVETSSNTASVHASPDGVKLVCFTRSLLVSRLDDSFALLENCAALCGYDIKAMNYYTGWSFAENSRLRRIYRDSSLATLGYEGEVIGIHAGLECGTVIAEIPDMDIISIGPDMQDLHTPAERLRVPSGDRVYDLVAHMLASIRE